MPSSEIQSPSFSVLPFDAHHARLLIHIDIARARDAAFAHAAGHHRGVAGHAAARGQNSGGDFHAGDVLGRGLAADENQLRRLVFVEALDRFFCAEDDLAHGRTRRCGQTCREHLDVLALDIEAGYEEIVKLVGLDAEDRFFFRDQPFVHHLDGDANCRATGALAVARLQHVQAPILDRELEILHVAVVLLQARGDFVKLLVNVRHDLLELRDVHRRAHARDHVLALRVHQELAVELFDAGGGIAREADAGAAGLAQIAEDHGLHVDRGAQHVVDIVDAAIVLGTVVLP